MRNTFLRTLCEEAERDDNIWLLCGDLGYSVLEPFMERFPNRFINVGVAEQNMIGVAAGLALSGKTVFTYTIGNFAFMRCMEQIRNEICYHNLNVKSVAVGGGFAYGSMGYTHHAIEDLAMLRVLPNITVVAPGDPVETELATRALCAARGPGYLRLGRGGEPVVHVAPPEFTLGKAIFMREGKTAAIISSAATLDLAKAAADRLEAEGHPVGLISMPTIEPFDAEAVLSISRQVPVLVTVEEHGRGGLATCVAETLAFHHVHTAIRPLFAHHGPASQAGDRNWQRERQGLTVDAIMQAVRS